MFCGGFVLLVLAQRDLLMYSLPANFYFPRKNDKLPRNDSTNSQQKVSRVWIGIYAMKAGKRRQSCVVVKCDRKWKYQRDLVDPVSGFIEASAVNDLSQDASSLQVECRKSGSLRDLGTFTLKILKKATVSELRPWSCVDPKKMFT